MAIRHKRARREQEELRSLEGALRETAGRLRQAYSAFDLVSDPDLVEAWVFEINAQQARYNYLLKQCRALKERPEGGAN